jgi:hypothetical protein
VTDNILSNLFGEFMKKVIFVLLSLSLSFSALSRSSHTCKKKFLKKNFKKIAKDSVVMTNTATGQTYDLYQCVYGNAITKKVKKLADIPSGTKCNITGRKLSCL